MFLTNLGVTKILDSFTLVLERKAGKEIHESSKMEFWGKISRNNIALPDAEDNDLGPLNKGSIADLLCWKHYQPSAKSHESLISVKCNTLLYYWLKKAWQLSEVFYNDQ